MIQERGRIGRNVREWNNESNGIDGPINIRSDLMSHGMVGGRHVGGMDSDAPNTLIYLVCPTALAFIDSLSRTTIQSVCLRSDNPI
jgi:hypothetical protein